MIYQYRVYNNAMQCNMISTQLNNVPHIVPNLPYKIISLVDIMHFLGNSTSLVSPCTVQRVLFSYCPLLRGSW